MKNKQAIILLSIINFIVPILGLFLNFVYYTLLQLSSNNKKIIFFNISFSMAYIGFLYFRVDNSGDVYRYGLSLYYYTQAFLHGRENIIVGLYESFYPVWYFIFYITNILNFDMRFINAIAGFTIYSSFFYVIYSIAKKHGSLNIDKIIVLKFFLIISFIGVYSSYKTLWSFSLVYLGLYLLLEKQKKGYVFLLLGVGIHPIALFPMLIYLISKYMKFKMIYLYISILIGLSLKYTATVFTVLLNIPFIGSKINSYIYGDWGQYRFQNNGEYFKFFILITFILFIFYILYFKLIELKTPSNNFFKKYNNFILWYFSISLWFISFRTIETRLIIDGVIFFFPLFYQLFLKRKIYKKNLIAFLGLIFWFILIDVRTFNFWNDSYQIGLGFPYNLFESPIFYILKGEI